MANAYYKNGSSWINMANVFYPVGAYYLANTSTSPSNLFGGTWSNLTGRFLYCNNGTAQNGENSHTLTIAEMPALQHKSNVPLNVGNAWAGGNSVQGNQGTAPFIKLDWGVETGGNAAHNNMPAYKTCYCWYRTA